MPTVWQSFKMTLYLRWLPSLRPGKEWTLGITQVVLDKDENIVDFARDSPLLKADDCHGYGVYRRTRWLMYLFVIFPKVFIGIVLWYYGLFFLVTSETDADLLLNAVALLFVLEVRIVSAVQIFWVHFGPHVRYFTHNSQTHTIVPTD
jgi:hypothetical protein